MFFYRVRLFSLSGFDVYVDASWLLLPVLISWSLAVGIFPNIVAGLSSATYWSMAVVAFRAYSPSPWVFPVPTAVNPGPSAGGLSPIPGNESRTAGGLDDVPPRL